MMKHYKVRPGFHVHRNGSVLSPGAIVEAHPEDVQNCLHQLEEVEIQESPTSRTRKPKATEGVES
jgi:hypothetical protein